ncbi:hypothetical protein GCM10010136_18330 [Limoniibacter endophyticus]|uniref:Uncharacterized protein n=1 Tax=Limoniibacter endophyticus TaxID=1565040 RepID=A0A8J3GG80_9HYPH|nr:hypothetical protein GCM10010136_18330 [Limoniibacter endophyticus]
MVAHPWHRRREGKLSAGIFRWAVAAGRDNLHIRPAKAHVEAYAIYEITGHMRSSPHEMRQFPGKREPASPELTIFSLINRAARAVAAPAHAMEVAEGICLKDTVITADSAAMA